MTELSEDQIDELSQKSLNRYTNRAVDSFTYASGGVHNALSGRERDHYQKMATKRRAGITSAINKMDAAAGRQPEKPVKVKARINEISSGRLLDRYMTKAKAEYDYATKASKEAGNNPDAKSYWHSDIRKRRKGLALASKKLSEQDQLDELSYTALNKYTTRAADSFVGAGTSDQTKHKRLSGIKLASTKKRAKIVNSKGPQSFKDAVDGRSIKEDQVDELSKETLGRYAKTATAMTYQHGAEGSARKGYNRIKGVSSAVGRIMRKTTKPEKKQEYIADYGHSEKIHEGKMSKAKLADHVTADDIQAHKDGTHTFRRGYFYHHGDTSDQYAGRVSKQLKDAGINHTVIDHDDIFKPFKGGAHVRNQSHFAARIKLHEEQVEENVPYTPDGMSYKDELPYILKDLRSKKMSHPNMRRKYGGNWKQLQRHAIQKHGYNFNRDHMLAVGSSQLKEGIDEVYQGGTSNYPRVKKGDKIHHGVLMTSGPASSREYKKIHWHDTASFDDQVAVPAGARKHPEVRKMIQSGKTTGKHWGIEHHSVSPDEQVVKSSVNNHHKRMIASGRSSKLHEDTLENLDRVEITLEQYMDLAQQHREGVREASTFEHNSVQPTEIDGKQVVQTRSHPLHNIPIIEVEVDSRKRFMYVDQLDEAAIGVGTRITHNGNKGRVTGTGCVPARNSSNGYDKHGPMNKSKPTPGKHWVVFDNGTKKSVKSHELIKEDNQLNEQLARNPIAKKGYVIAYKGGFKSSDKHGHVKYWNAGAKKSAYRHAGIILEDDQELEEAYRVVSVSSGGETFKSRLFATKKEADNYHWRLVKSDRNKPVNQRDKSHKVVTEQLIDELSRAKLGSYIKRASPDSEVQGHNARAHLDIAQGIHKRYGPDDEDGQYHTKHFLNHSRKADNRSRGVQKAADKLMKEEALDELSKRTLSRYKDKACKQTGKQMAHGRGIAGLVDRLQSIGKVNRKLAEDHKVGDLVKFKGKKAFKNNEWGEYSGRIIHDHGDGRYNINYTHDEASKRRHGGHQYPATVHKDNILKEEMIDEISKEKTRAYFDKASTARGTADKFSDHPTLTKREKGLDLAFNKLMKPSKEDIDRDLHHVAYQRKFRRNGVMAVESELMIGELSTDLLRHYSKKSIDQLRANKGNKNFVVKGKKRDKMVDLACQKVVNQKVKVKASVDEQSAGEKTYDDYKKKNKKEEDKIAKELDAEINIKTNTAPGTDAANKRLRGLKKTSLEEGKGQVSAYDKEGNLVGNYKDRKTAELLKPNHTYKVNEQEDLDEGRRGRPPKSGKGVEGDEPNIIMSLRKAAYSTAGHEVPFKDGSKHTIHDGPASKVLSHFNGLRPHEKEQFQHHISKSRDNFDNYHKFEPTAHQRVMPSERPIEGGHRTIKKANRIKDRSETIRRVWAKIQAKKASEAK